MVMGLSDENIHPDQEEPKTDRITSLFDDEPSFRQKLIARLTKITRSPRIWYVAGVIDTLAVLWIYKHFIA